MVEILCSEPVATISMTRKSHVTNEIPDQVVPRSTATTECMQYWDIATIVLQFSPQTCAWPWLHSRLLSMYRMRILSEVCPSRIFTDYPEKHLKSTIL